MKKLSLILILILCIGCSTVTPAPIQRPEGFDYTAATKVNVGFFYPAHWANEIAGYSTEGTDLQIALITRMQVEGKVEVGKVLISGLEASADEVTLKNAQFFETSYTSYDTTVTLSEVAFQKIPGYKIHVINATDGIYVQQYLLKSGKHALTILVVADNETILKEAEQIIATMTEIKDN